MQKKMLAALTLLLLAVFLFSCDAPLSQENPMDPTNPADNLAALAEALLTEASFTDDLAPIDDHTVTVLYGIDNAVEQYVYIGSGATPEELALFAFSSEGDAEAGFALAWMRVADQKEAFSDYNAWEMPKLEDAVVKQYGNVVVLCISCDEQAKTILAEHFGQ